MREPRRRRARRPPPGLTRAHLQREGRTLPTEREAARPPHLARRRKPPSSHRTLRRATERPPPRRRAPTGVWAHATPPLPAGPPCRVAACGGGIRPRKMAARPFAAAAVAQALDLAHKYPRRGGSSSPPRRGLGKAPEVSCSGWLLLGRRCPSGTRGSRPILSQR